MAIATMPKLIHGSYLILCRGNEAKMFAGMSKDPLAKHIHKEEAYRGWKQGQVTWEE